MYRIIITTRGRRRVYGIAGSGIKIEDISTRRGKVEALAKRCRWGKLDPDHLRDVVEDWMGEFTV